MASDNRLIFNNTIILYFRMIISSVIGLFTTRFVLQALGSSDFGLYNVIGGLVVMMAFLNGVMVSTTYRYIAYEMGKGNNKGIIKVFNISLVIHLGMAFLVLVLSETAGVYYIKHYLNVSADNVGDALFVFRFSAYATIFYIISVPYLGLITAHEKFAARAMIEIIRNVLMFFVAIIIIFYLGNKLRLYALLVFFVNIVPTALFYYYCKRKYREIVKWKFQKDRGKYKEMISFSGWIMIGAAASVGQTSGSALIVNSVFGTVLNASFGIANQVNSIVLMFARNLGQAATPQITKSFSSGNSNRTITLAAHISKYSVFLMLLPSLPILLETEYLLSLWLVEVPPYTVIFCQLMIINALVNGLTGGLASLIQATGKIKIFQIILSSTSLLSLPIGYFLFKTGHPPSSIIIVFISTALINVVVWQILLKIIIDFDVKYFLKKSYLKVFSVAILMIPLFFIRDLFAAGILRFIFFSLLSLFWLLVIMYLAGTEKKEKEMLGKAIIKLIRK